MARQLEQQGKVNKALCDFNTVVCYNNLKYVKAVAVRTRFDHFDKNFQEILQKHFNFSKTYGIMPLLLIARAYFCG